MPKSKKTVTSKTEIKKSLSFKKKKVAVAVNEKLKKKIVRTGHKESSTKKTVSSVLSLPVVSPQGEKISSISVPQELFGVRFNRQLVSQALRVFRLNQQEGSAATKTRGMVEGSTRKIYRQKGTGRARHGGIRAPVFVGGGIVFGPVPKNVRKSIPKHMKTHALSSALSYKRLQNAICIVDGIIKLPIKTKACDQMLRDLKLQKPLLFVYGEESNVIVRAVRNIERVSVSPYDSLNTYDVMTNKTIIFTKDGLVSLIANYSKKQL